MQKIVHFLIFREKIEKALIHTDKTLVKFLSSKSVSRRRQATCSKIDKLENQRQLVNFMENRLRGEFVTNFLL